MSKMVQEEGSSSVTSSPLKVFSMMSLSPSLGSPFPWLREMKSEERGLYLIQLLISCANQVTAGSLENANIGLDHISHLASPGGDTMQRIASYFTEALADRVLKSWTGIYKAINATKMSIAADKILAQKLFFQLCPFLKRSYLMTNQAIMKAMEGEKMVHIIDLFSFEPAQWISLLQEFKARPEGPPHLRITGIHEQKEVLEHMAFCLTEEAEKLDISFQFHSFVGTLENVDVECLRVKTGEALAVSSVLQLHSLLASEVDMCKRNSSSIASNSNTTHLQRNLHNQRTFREWLEKDLGNIYSLSPEPDSMSPSSNKMENFLTSLWSLSPKIVVLTEQESNHNGASLMERVTESLYYYAALFDCLESTIPRTSVERLKVEKMLFGEEIKNIIGCEGLERKERHEKLEKWIMRMELAGFERVGFGVWNGERLLQGYDGYEMKEENGCLFLCWHERPLFSVSAWRFRR
ncbi:unnamed protein product [Rhodiola kirilowii]